MQPAVDALLAILDLEPLEHNLFRGRSPRSGWQRVFGGQVVGQALAAACRTVEGRRPHSLHAYFLLGGDPKVPIIYEVDRIRDGGSFTTRRVVAVQHGRPIFAMSASFHAPEPGFDHQASPPGVPRPEALADATSLDVSVLPAPVRAYFTAESPIEFRPVDTTRYAAREPQDAAREPKEARFDVWMRAAGSLPDDPAIHACVLAYASDLTLLDTALIAHGRTVFDPDIQPASLDHALWFHRPFRADEWLLYTQDSPSAAGGRGFSRGLIFTAGGALVASVAQEGLIRTRDPGRASK